MKIHELSSIAEKVHFEWVAFGVTVAMATCQKMHHVRPAWGAVLCTGGPVHIKLSCNIPLSWLFQTYYIYAYLILRKKAQIRMNSMTFGSNVEAESDVFLCWIEEMRFDTAGEFGNGFSQRIGCPHREDQFYYICRRQYRDHLLKENSKSSGIFSILNPTRRLKILLSRIMIFS